MSVASSIVGFVADHWALVFTGLSVVGTCLVFAWKAGGWFQQQRVQLLEDRIKAKDEEIAKLKAAQAAVPMPGSIPGQLTAPQMEQFTKIIGTTTAVVEVVFGSSASATLLASQFETAFRRSGWEVTGGAMWADIRSPHGIVVNIPTGPQREYGEVIATALATAEIPFERASSLPAADSHPRVVLSRPVGFSATQNPAAAGNGSAGGLRTTFPGQ